MIKAIQRIKDFGVFGDYTRPADTTSFGDRNIIYGWNYSGKTTLSRLFYCLEAKQLHPDYPLATFSIDVSSEMPLTEAGLATDTTVVRVFNTDFVARNLKWDGAAFEPVLLIGEESIEIQGKIADCNAKIERCRIGSKKKCDDAADISRQIAKKMTEGARAIREALGQTQTFTATHLGNIIETIKLAGPETFLLQEDKVKNLQKLAYTPDSEKLEVVAKVGLKATVTPILDACRKLFLRVPAFSNTIDYLRDHPTVANWVEQGLFLHEFTSSCEFCGSELDANRMKTLHSHFSKDLTNFKDELHILADEINAARLSFSGRANGLFYADLRDEASVADNTVKVAVESFNTQLDRLAAAVEKKLDAPFKVVDCPPVSLEHEKKIEVEVARINRVIEANNKMTDNFATEKAEAVRNLKNHFVAEFIGAAEIKKMEESRDRKLRHRGAYDAVDAKLKLRADELVAKISQAEKGREDLNVRISSLLGSSSISIEVINEGQGDRFRLERGGRRATNLSEGEKTAIAFAYFMSKLLEAKDFKEVVVYIDDPISSLDSNHIFQVSALIRDTFFTKVSKEKWATKCKQLFISTHNFEFFSLLKELKGEKQYFQIRKTDTDVSVLCNLPKSMTKYPSEYHYLYSVIKAFSESTNKTDVEVLLPVPNAVRRFVELYTMARIPMGGSVDDRAEVLFGAVPARRVLKVMHHFSHLNSIDRLVTNSDLICDIENAVSELMVVLKEDAQHHQALEAAVS